MSGQDALAYSGAAFLCVLAWVLNAKPETAAKWDRFWRSAWAWVVRKKK